LAGLAEQEFGMESNAMFNDLHAPSVPVQPLDGGRATTTTKVRINLFIISYTYSFFRMVLWLMNLVYPNSQHRA
jgi:hypothetical protein